MEKLAKAYIEGRIQTTRTNTSDKIVNICTFMLGGSHVKNALESAESGLPEETASYLKQATLPIGQKGEILAKAYMIYAFQTADQAEYPEWDPPVINKRKASKIAQGLRRAAQRSQKS